MAHNSVLSERWSATCLACQWVHPASPSSIAAEEAALGHFQSVHPLEIVRFLIKSPLSQYHVWGHTLFNSDAQVEYLDKWVKDVCGLY